MRFQPTTLNQIVFGHSPPQSTIVYSSTQWLCLNQFHGCPSPPPGRLSGICHFGEKMLQMPHHGVQIMQQNPHPLRIFEPKTRMHALSRINITVFKIDSVAISFQNVLIKILKSQNLI